ncbi:MAG: DNA repair protein RadC [Patescibacteria group bacterium]
MSKSSLYVRTLGAPLVLEHAERRYELTIHDIPNDERPRERLVSQGAKHLSTVELLAVVLTTGTTKEGVLTMANRIVQEYGARSLASQRDPRSLAVDLGIPLGKAAQIVACAELGRRFFAKNENGTPTIRTPRDVFEHTRDMQMLTKEHLRGLYLNSHYKLIHDEVISIGTIDTSLVHPREVFKPAIEHAAAAVVLVHNHPSGITDPSAADLAITMQLIEAGKLIGVQLIDHVIVTKDEFASIPSSYTTS